MLTNRGRRGHEVRENPRVYDNLDNDNDNDNDNSAKPIEPFLGVRRPPNYPGNAGRVPWRYDAGARRLSSLPRQRPRSG
jgi:hypothetical protein